MSKQDGGPDLVGGMNLRDYFAAHAIGQVVIDSDELHEARKAGAAGVATLIAKACYEFADAMLKARER